MPLWGQILFLVVAAPIILVVLFAFFGGIKTEDYTKRDRSGSVDGGGGGFGDGDCGGDGD